MMKVPFIVACTSCESVLEVRNPGLVGKIIVCPKCGSMVRIEPTSQSRPLSTQMLQYSQSVDTILSEVSPIPESSVSIPDEWIEDDIPLVVAEEGFGNCVGDKDQFGSVAAELQEKFLNDVVIDPWQKRRLVVVAVGTICLLTIFAVFLWIRVIPERVPTTAQEPGVVVNPNAPPPLPGGIGASQIGGQPDHLHNETPLSSGNSGQDTSTPLPLADAIKVEGQTDSPDPGDMQPDATNEQNDTIALVIEPTVSGPPRPPRPGINSLPGQPGAAVRVTPFPTGFSGDPFDDIDDRVDNRITDPGPEVSGNDLANDLAENDSDPGETMNDTADESDDFADLFENDTLSSPGANELEMTKTDDDTVITTPDMNVEPDIPESDITGSFVHNIHDIDERLALTVTSIQIEKTAIVDVVRALSDLSGVPMQLDIDELRARGISVESPISLQVRETTIAGIIGAVLEKTRLTRYDGNSHLVFGYSDEQVSALRTARYQMSRLATLAQDPISAEQAVSWLTELLVNHPQARNATIAVDGNEIVVVGPIWLQDQARRLLLTLFYLRDLEPENGLAPERLAPEVFGWDRVHTILSFNLVEPVPLKRALQLIEGHTKLRILTDHAALYNEGFSQETPVTSRVSNGTIDTVLCGMLEPLGLTYRIVEANAVEITSPRVAREKMTIEAHKYTPLADDQTPESCAEALRQAFGGNASWDRESGNGTGGTPFGGIVIDPVSGYMLVRQSQAMQRDIRLWFGRMHTEEETKTQNASE